MALRSQVEETESGQSVHQTSLLVTKKAVYIRVPKFVFPDLFFIKTLLLLLWHNFSPFMEMGVIYLRKPT